MAKKKNNAKPAAPTPPSAKSAAPKPLPKRDPATAAPSSPVRSRGTRTVSPDSVPDLRGAADASPAKPGNPGYDEIAEAAYHRYLGRGARDGGDFDDWVEAERDLRARQSK